MNKKRQVFSGNGDIAALLGKTDWRASPIGEPDSWPRSLSTMVSFALHSPLAMAVVWGKDMITIYNDAYGKILGDKHPAVFGKPFSEVWAERWERARPLVDKAYAGDASFFEDIPFSVRREGKDIPAWITYSCSPVLDEHGDVCGITAVCVDTTEKVSLRLAQEAESRRMLDLFEQAPGLVAVLRGPDHVFEFMNEAYRDFIGGQDFIGMPVKEALPDLAAQGFGELADRVFRTGEPFIGTEVPAQVRRWPGGTLEDRYFDFIYQPIRDESGKVTGLFTEGVDVTERVRRNQARRESDMKILQLADMIPQLTWIADANGSVTWCNKRWHDYTGLSAADVQGWGWQHLLEPEALPDVMQRWKASQQSGAPYEGMARMRGKDGKYRPFYILAIPLKDDAGQVTQWFGTNTDVSTLHEAQDELRRTQDWLQQGLDTGKMAVWEWQPQSGVIKYSDNAANVLGHTVGDAADGWTHVHPDDASRMQEVIGNAIAACGSFHETSRWVDPGTGKVTWVEQRGKVICSERGEPVSLVGINIDVTDRMLAELELKEASRRKDEFLAMLAHELRNPLAPISTAAYLLKVASHDERRIQQTSDIINRQVQHMTELLDDLLDVSRVTRGLVVLQKERVDLKYVVASAIEQARSQIEARQHELRTRIASASAFAEGDHTRLVQVLTNLLNNACRYTPPGGEITIALDVLEADIKLSVADTGIGIEADLLPRIFDLFTQGKRTPDRAQGGLGLGLALVKSLAGMHGGRIEVHSDGQGKGSLFSVYLPRLPDLAAVRLDVHHSLPASSAKRLRITIVDDNADAARMLAEALLASGHAVIASEDGASVLGDVEASASDVFILDIGLPGIDGYELARRLRRQEASAGAVLIALTGYGQDSDLALAREAGFDHHLVKPVRFERLQELLNALPLY
ncbi:hybrid sensor histidine kinase/response regulator [Noviherbaspirillum galbum]|uniref:histidine kinase n=1 Tax=Noviherbaspirillum galbum TaxID=2709383 RepID=A0A6B3SN87_9BURK|nr:PAS domain-containing protein [Noviherbaspirillum galbum]NEX61918.1 PAS domain-containing protein [Noviherbaspirillum galbum]